MTDNKNTILAIALSALVLIAWQFFIGMPQQKARQEALKQQQQTQAAAADRAGGQPGQARRRRPRGGARQRAAGARPGHGPGRRHQETRAQALAKSPRVQITTGSLTGSIALKGARIDDLSLNKFHETVDKNSPPIVLLVAVRQPRPVLRRVRLDRRRRQQRSCPPATRCGSRSAPAISASATR